MPSVAPSAVTLAGPLMLGSRGASVEALQRLLQQASTPGPVLAVDGAFGIRTDAAVRAFQRRKGLNPDGIVGANTAQALGANFVRQPQPLPRPSPPGTVPPGATNVPAAVLISVIHKALKRIQQRIESGFNNGFNEPDALKRATSLLRFAVNLADQDLAAAARGGLSAASVASHVNSALASMAGGLQTLAAHVAKNGGDASDITAIMVDLRRRTSMVVDVVRKTLEGKLDGGLRSGVTLLHDLLDRFSD